MGNGFILEELLEANEPERLLRQLAAALPAQGQLLFSRERFIRSLAPKLGELETLALAAGFEGLRLLLFVRDPLEHAHSLHAEMVKAHGFSGSVEEWLELYNLHEAVELFLSTAADLPFTVLTAFNYSLAPQRLLQQSRSWLGMPASAVLEDPPAARVNRSLSRPELQALKVLNRLLGPAAGAIGRRLVNDLPALPVVPDVAEPAAQQAFLDRLAPAVGRINALLPAEQALRLRRLPHPAGPAEETIPLLPPQLEVIAEELLRLGAERRESQGQTPSAGSMTRWP
jgi:hypothetical protein